MSYFKSGIRSEFLSKIPNLRSPYLICGFPGTGYVGKMVVDHLIQELKAVHLADIYCTSFPPRVIIGTDGTVDLTRNSIYYSRHCEAHKDDLVFVTGDAQPVSPESEYYLAEEILKIVTQFDTKQVFTLGAYITGAFAEKPKVYCMSTDLETLHSLSTQDISHLDNGSVTGMNGLVIGIAKLLDMKGVCFLAETSGYVIDAIASKNILEALMFTITLKVNMESMILRAKDTEMLIRTIEQQIVNKVAPPNSEVGAQVSPKRQPDTGYIS